MLLGILAPLLTVGTGTQFALIKAQNNLEDFFLIDENIFENEGQVFVPIVDKTQLLSYKLLPQLTETSLVNLGFLSGLISHALNLDEIKHLFPPATCKANFTFRIRPHSSDNEYFVHNQGQVEIDAMFVAKRKGVDTLFVMEA